MTDPLPTDPDPDDAIMEYLYNMEAMREDARVIEARKRLDLYGGWRGIGEERIPFDV